MTTQEDIVLTLNCPDQTGIVAAVTSFLAERDGFITELSHYADPASTRSFVRAVFHADGTRMPNFEKLKLEFAAVEGPFKMTANFYQANAPTRALVMVSKFGHCLNSLLHSWRAEPMPIDIVGVISNHDDMRSLVDWYEIPYQHMPVSAETRAQQESALLDFIEKNSVDLVVLARYMQILSPELCKALSWRTINIHHSFLPSFTGARPYHQAHTRGVKIIGATAHYVTTDLDEGPIIEQSVERVDHTRSPDDLVRIGRDIESIVLNRAVRWHAEHRILPNGSKTVVFN